MSPAARKPASRRARGRAVTGRVYTPGTIEVREPAASKQKLLTRRDLLIGGSIAAAAVTAGVPLYAYGSRLIPGPVGGTGVLTAASKARPHRPGVPGLHGATLSKSAFPKASNGKPIDFPAAVKLWESYTGTKIQAWKVYYQRDHFPTTLVGRVKALHELGIKALICYRTDFQPNSPANLKRLEQSLKAYKKAGVEADVAIWQEPQVTKGHPSAEKFIGTVAYYGPVVREFYPLVYDASGAAGPAGWEQYYPGDDLVDKVAVDFYAHHFAQGERIDAVAALADHANPPKPFGIWEMGDRSAKVDVPTDADIVDYMNYMTNFMARRLVEGKANADIVWYDHGVSSIKTTKDFRVPLWQQLVRLTSQTSPSIPRSVQAGATVKPVPIHGRHHHGATPSPKPSPGTSSPQPSPSASASPTPSPTPSSSQSGPAGSS